MEVVSGCGVLLLWVLSIQPLLTEANVSKLVPLQVLRGSGNRNELVGNEHDQSLVPNKHTSFKLHSYNARALLRSKLDMEDDTEDSQEQYSIEDNCTNPRNPPAEYNSSCNFVKKECGHKAELFDYLQFMLCDIRKAQPLGYIILAVWLVYLISLLATTVDNYFFPPLIFLAEKLRLSPSIAGVTLLALGNGAPDVFVVFSGLAHNDLALVLGALTGGGIFITTVVLGTVILVTKARPYKIDKVDFVRDVIAFMVVVGTVIAVALDGVVYLLEACLFPLIYIIYIITVIAIGFARTWWKRKHLKSDSSGEEEKLCAEETTAGSTEKIIAETITADGVEQSTASVAEKISVEQSTGDGADKSTSEKSTADSTEKITAEENIIAATKEVCDNMPCKTDISLTNVSDEATPLTETTPLTEGKDSETTKKAPNCLYGLSWPKGSRFLVKILWLVQWPFSLLRWITIPPFSYKGTWSVGHYLFAVCSPIPMAFLLLLAIKGSSGFTMFIGRMPLPALLAVIGLVLTVLLVLSLRPKRPPHWSMQLVLVSFAFVMSIIWLNLEANEVVSVLKAFGLLLDIDTGILGLTILAFGNCVADWVADTMVARSGKPEMAVASCFGSPLLSHVVGLSIAMIVKIGISDHGAPYRFHIHTSEFAEVKISWIFLSISLLSSLFLFPIFKFSPPRKYGVILFLIYVVFVVMAVLSVAGVLAIPL